jgi:NCS1 family nucleobase:cation symporter-1
VLGVAMISLCIATLATNIAANVVSPANDLANLWPKRIDFRRGGYITGVIGILMQPWKLVADPTGYIFKWLVAYSSLLGAIGGVLICDYYVLRKCELSIPELYEPNGRYWYSGGFNPKALIALVLGIVPLVPGFLGTIGAAHVAPFWTTIYNYAWFISFGISFAAYWAMMGAVKDH